MKTKKQIVLGQTREILATVGLLFFGTMSGWESLTGLIVAVVAVIWALWNHEGREMIYSSIRKVLSLAPGVAVACGWLPAKFEPLALSMLLPLFAMVWSYKANGGKQKIDAHKTTQLLVFSFATLCLSSCAGTVDLNTPTDPNAVRGSITGVILTSDETGQLKPKVDRTTIIGWLGKIGRIAAGEDVKDVILPSRSVEPQK